MTGVKITTSRWIIKSFIVNLCIALLYSQVLHTCFFYYLHLNLSLFYGFINKKKKEKNVL